jgi:flagellum-specific peptidoglycan hydrolase FlgJ
MMDPVKQQWLENAAAEAAKAGHIFAQMAAAEAALESNFGQSGLARQANNLFGMKQHAHPIFGTMVLPTREFLNGQWITVSADWVKYDSLEECFGDRMDTLHRLRDAYPHYGLALTAPDPDTYIQEVSKTWSTDPQRAAKVMAIYQAYFVSSNNAPDVQSAAQGEG